MERLLKCVLCQRAVNKASFYRLCNTNRALRSDAVNISEGPLHGVRILDLSRVLAGPYCTMILGDMGAEVIKVERPGTGDDTRSWGPPFCNTESAYFLSINRNKKSITVDLKHPKGRDIVQKMASMSDVLVENYLPGKLEAMGLGFRQISSINPRLVYCSITGYGQKGPNAHRAGYDVIVSGVGGLMHITGPKDGEPCKVGVAMTDLSTGLYAQGAIMAALLDRQKTGLGQHIDCNLFSTQIASLVNIASNYLNSGLEATRHGTAHPSIVPYQAFKTKDGYILVGAGNDGQFKILCKCLGQPQMSTDDRYVTNKVRVANRQSLLQSLSEIFQQKTTADWLFVLEGSGIPYGPINNMQAVFSDPQVVDQGLIQEIPHPTIGTVRLPAPAAKFSRTETVNPTAPPTLGQHTDEILQNILGMTEAEVAVLKQEKVV